PFTWRSVAETISAPGMHRATRGKSFMYFHTWSTGAGMVNSFSISTFQSPSSELRPVVSDKPYLVRKHKVHMTTRQYAHLEGRLDGAFSLRATVSGALLSWRMRPVGCG